MNSEQAPTTMTRKILNVLVVIFIIIVVTGVALGPTTPPSGYSPAVWKASEQNARIIGLSLFQYSQDNNGHYPEGKTSTEVFQHLIDEKYVTNPTVFFTSFVPGKVRPQGDHLKAENVCWDVTDGIDPSAPNGLPVVFSTGYKFDYKAGASAFPVGPVRPLRLPKNMYEWVNGVWVPIPFIAVCYKNDSAVWIKANKDRSIPNFIPIDFDPKGKIYRQLTP
jgi:hypothetical protein